MNYRFWFAWMLTVSMASATIINVPSDYSTIQAAIDASFDGDIIVVADGIYYENLTIANKAIWVLSTGGQENCIINGNRVGEVVSFFGEEIPDSSIAYFKQPGSIDLQMISQISDVPKLSGFTLTNGYGHGAGIRIEDYSPVISECRITDNLGHNVGGILVSNGSPLISNCIIDRNSSDYADARSAGVEIWGNSTVTMTNCRVTKNTAPTGAGIHLSSGGGATLIAYGCLIDSNYTQPLQESSSGQGEAGGIYNQSSNVILINCTIANNRSDKWGGGIFTQSNPAHTRLINTIFWGNSPNQIYLGGANPGPNDIEVDYSIIEGGIDNILVAGDNATDPAIIWGSGNIDSDPLFVIDSTDYHLQGNSPGIDAGNPDTFGLALPSKDHDGNFRVWDGNGDDLTIVDIGAYEYGAAETPPGPSIIQIPTQSVLEDSSVALTLVTEGQPDTTATYRILGDSRITAETDSAIITLIPEADFFTTDSIPLFAQAANPYNMGPLRLFYLKVVPVNDRPLATLTSAIVGEDGRTPITLTGIAGPENEFDQNLSFMISSLPGFGGISLSAEGPALTSGELPAQSEDSQVYFIPSLDRFDSTEFYYQVIDDGGTQNGGEDTSDPSMVALILEVAAAFTLDTSGPIEGGVALIESNILYAPASGDLVYRFDDAGIIEYTLNVNGDIKSSTTITPDHTVYIASTDNNLYSFNANGVSNPNWPLALGAEATASVAMDANRNVYIGTQNGIFQAVSPDGDVMWGYNVGGAVYASAAISLDNTLYIVNHNGRLYAFDLSTLDPANVQYKWRIETGGNITSSPALDDSSHVYLTTLDGRLLKVLDESTTGTIVWELNIGSPIESSPIIDSEYTIYLGCDDGKVYAVDRTGSFKWEQTTGGAVKSSAALVEEGTETDRLYIGSDDGYLYALSLADGTIIWRYNAQAEIKAPTLYQGGRIYTGTVGGQIIAISDPDVSQSLGKVAVVRRIWPTFQGDNARTGYQGSAGLHITGDSKYLPSVYELHPNFPNPFNPSTTLKFELPEAVDINITIYDILGREVTRLLDGHAEGGYHQVIWGSSADGHALPSGIYIARLVTPAYSKSIKMVLLK